MRTYGFETQVWGIVVNRESTKEMSAQEVIRSLEADYLKTKVPDLQIGDTVKVGVRIQEGGKERTQPYEGTVIAMRGNGINKSITVRRATMVAPQPGS